MAKLVKPQFRLLILACCCALVGCRAHRSPLITREAVIGTYAYKSEDASVDRATDHELDHLVLEANGRYDLVQGGSTKAKTETIGEWTLVTGASGRPEIILDHAGYPIHTDGSEIRLMINDDLGEWYAKTKN